MIPFPFIHSLTPRIDEEDRFTEHNSLILTQLEFNKTH